MNLQEGGPSKAQTDWLAADLASSTAACTIASFHYPVLNVGPRGDTPALFSTWAQLVNGGVDIVLTGHDHNYQRWTPLGADLTPDAGGATQFVLGAGGHGVQSFTRTDSRLAFGSDQVPTSYGALRLALNSGGAAFDYRSTAGNVLDSGTVACSGAGPDTLAPTTPTDLQAVATTGIQVDLSWQASTDNVGVDAYRILRDGTQIATVGGLATSHTDTPVSPDTTYEYSVVAVDAAGNTSAPTPPVQVSTAAAPPTVTYQPVADAYVDDSFPGSNFGTSVMLRTDSSPLLRSYLRFDVAGLSGPVQSAMLRVHADSSHGAGYEVRASSGQWTETGVTYSNSPSPGTLLGGSGPMTADTWNTIDVTGYVTGNGTVDLALTPLNSTNLRLSSRETATPAELVVVQEVAGNTPPTATDVSLSTSEDTSGSWTPDVADAQSDPLSCSISTQPAHGTASVATDCSSGSYTPAENWSGTDTFTYAVTDGPTSATATVTATVSPVNDAPTTDDVDVTVVPPSRRT